MLDIGLNFPEVAGGSENPSAGSRVRKLDFRPIVGIQVMLGGIKCISEIGVCFRWIAWDFVVYGRGGIGFRIFSGIGSVI